MSALRHRNFALVWSGQIVSSLGDGMRTLALLWWAKTHSGSNAVVIAVAAAASVPVVLASPLGGWAADRFDRRRLMVVADLHRGAVSAALAALLFSGRLTPGLLCALVALAAMGTALFEPTFAAAVPTLVPDEDRAKANGLNMVNTAAGGLLGPLLGGALLAVSGPGWVLGIDAVSFLVSTAFVALARVPRSVSGSAADDDEAAPVTVRTVLADRTVRRLAGLASVLNLVAAPIGVLLVALAVDRFGVGPRTFGILEMTIPAGVIAGALLAGAVAERRAALVCSLVAVGASLAITGAVPLAGAMVALTVCGAALAVANTVLITTMQHVVAPEVQGRAFGLLTSVTTGLRPAGLALAGPLLAVAGVSGAFALVGLGMVAASVLWARPMGETGRGEAAASRYREPLACS